MSQLIHMFMQGRGDGYLYFIAETPRSAIKIGWSLDPCRRLATLQIGNPRKLRILGLIAGTPYLEDKWHGRFRHLQLRQEWFRGDRELIEAIEAERTHSAKPHKRDGRTTRAGRIVPAHTPLTPGAAV